MRASRLLSVLLTLQTRGRVTARELADELEVSIRTIYRDIDALAAAGVPVYAERGPAGGYRLLEGFRTRLNGLTGDEADSLLLAGLPRQAAELGLGAVVASAQLKVIAGLPPDLRERAARARQRFHLDAPGWYRESDPAEHLAEVAAAVWNDRPVRVRYRRWGGEVDRDLDPYGLVVKGGAWYLVARVAGRADLPARTYRVARILAVETLPGTFARDPEFDLPRYWADWSAGAGARMLPMRAVVRLAPEALRMVPYLYGDAAARVVAETTGDPDGDGWVRAVLPVESARTGARSLLRLAGDIEVLEPPELRAEFVAAAREALARHGG